jgi:hypothetical protein
MIDFEWESRAVDSQFTSSPAFLESP